MQDIDIDRLVKLVKLIKGSKFLPKYLKDANDEDICFTILRGWELGLQPLQSLSALYEKEARLTLDAAGMRALVLRAGHKMNIVERSVTTCTLRGTRVEPDSTEWAEQVTYTLEDARLEGVLNKPFWMKYPASMLLARATGILVRFMFADIIQGLYGTEEADDALPVLRESEAMNAFAHLSKPITGATRDSQAPPIVGNVPPKIDVELGKECWDYTIKSESFPGKNKSEPIGTWSIGSLRYALGTGSIKATLTEEDIDAMNAVVKHKILESAGMNNGIDNITLGE